MRILALSLLWWAAMVWLITEFRYPDLHSDDYTEAADWQGLMAIGMAVWVVVGLVVLVAL